MSHELAHHRRLERHPRPARGRGRLQSLRGTGWFEDPASYHQDPPPLERPEIHYQERRGRNIECLTFESLYEPHTGEPGRERWLGYEKNRTVHAWVLRHDDDEERPWLVCVHGIRMGTLGKSLTRFRPEYLHEELGLNLLMPVLPLHGPRDTGLVSGERTLSGDVMDTLHTGAQAVWDLRRLVSWPRETEGGPGRGRPRPLFRRLRCLAAGLAGERP